MKNKEVEFKYKATVTLSDFKAFCESKRPVKTAIVSGFDHFYANDTAPDSFYRHRVNTNENQLTFKRKSKAEDNYIREEHNIDLPLTVTEEKISDLCNISGYKYNSTIFKNAFIYNYEYYTLVYYICYDRELNELGRFIEIEMKEDYNWNNEQEAYNEMVSLEKLMKPLGIASFSRISQSLFEMFRRK